MDTLHTTTPIDRTSYFENTRPEMAALLPRDLGRVLEIGCGAGAFSDHLRDASEHWGVEPDPVAAQRARSRGVTVVVGTFDQAVSSLPEEGFDTVVCNDVIEHMTDHDEFLRTIQDHMAPDGTLVGSVPNIRHLPHLFNLVVRKDWRYTEDGTLDRTHQRYFTEKSLHRSLDQAGFDVLTVEGINGAGRRPRSLRSAAKLAAVVCFNVLTLGSQRDAEFLQIAFVARPRRSPAR